MTARAHSFRRCAVLLCILRMYDASSEGCLLSFPLFTCEAPLFIQLILSRRCHAPMYQKRLCTGATRKTRSNIGAKRVLAHFRPPPCAADLADHFSRLTLFTFFMRADFAKSFCPSVPTMQGFFLAVLLIFNNVCTLQGMR